MNVASYILLALVIVWAIFAVWHILRHGSCGCGGKNPAENRAAAAVSTAINNEESWYGKFPCQFFGFSGTISNRARQSIQKRNGTNPR